MRFYFLKTLTLFALLALFISYLFVLNFSKKQEFSSITTFTKLSFPEFEDLLINSNLRSYVPKPKNDESLFSNKTDCFSGLASTQSILALNSSQKLSDHPNCGQSWIRIDDQGRLFFNKTTISIDSCEYSIVEWFKDDFNFKLGKFKPISNGTQLDTNQDFFHLNCRSKNGLVFQTAFARVFKNKNKFNSQNSPKKPINLFMIGLDSISREEWIINLPKSSQFLINQMQSKVLSRYNIMGDGTPSALVPILTGKHQNELPNTMKNTENASFVDKVYPFIWKDFKRELNFTTLFSEDWPHIGTFQYRMIGMSEPPVDHYMRPFHLSITNLVDSNSCLKGQSKIKVTLDYAKDFIDTYKEKGFFGFSYLNEYSHDSTERLSWIDKSLYDFLVKFYDDKSLSDNTVLILFADHGPRFTSNRKSIKGLLNERNPFFSIYLPKEFKQRYPKQHEIFETNINKLTTPLDVHRTLLDLIHLQKFNDLNKENDKRSISLFNNISNERTCDQAGITQHWCGCMKRTELEIDSHLTQLAKMFVDYLNTNLLKNLKDKCHRLELKKINKVFLLNTLISLKNKKPIVRDPSPSIHLLKPPQVEKDYQKYFFQISVEPNDAVYEFTATDEYDLKKQKSNILINEESISRINKYGYSADCISKDFPDLRKYCFCK